jgi:hypothetical protein
MKSTAGGALVVSTCHDRATGCAFEAARDMKALLETRFGVEFIGPTVPRAVVESVLRQAPHGPWKIVCLCGHGGQPFFVPEFGMLARDAIVVLTACLHKDAGLPAALVTRSTGVRAVIGYDEVAYTGGRADVLVLHAADRTGYLDGLRHGFVRPVRRLLDGATVEDAVRDARTLWKDLWQDGRFGHKLRSVFGANAALLNNWGEPQATLT